MFRYRVFPLLAISFVSSQLTVLGYIIIYIYSQHALSGSTVFVVVLLLVGFQISIVGVFSGRVVFSDVVCVAGSSGFFTISG